MRLLPFALFLTLCGLAFGQAPPASTPDRTVQAVHPDVVIFIQSHAAADVLKISMVDPNYPEELLKKQIETLCTSLNAPAQNLQVYRYQMGANDHLQFLEASFATANLTDSDRWANLTPLIRAFAGVPAPHTIKGMEVFFDEYDPPIVGPKNFSSAAVTISGRVDSSPPEVEYAIQLLKQNPSEISVEKQAKPVESTVKQETPQKSGSVLVWCLILVAGVAAGALVYFLLTRRAVGDPSTPVSRKP